MLQRIGLAQALINDPKLVILDEPLGGLDPLGRKEIRDIIVRFKQEGKTVFFTSHILQDIEMICDHVAIIVGGRVVKQGALQDLVSEKVLFTEVTVIGRYPSEAFQGLGESVSVQGERVLLKVFEESRVDDVLALVRERKGKVISLSPRTETLEDIFVETVSREMKITAIAGITFKEAKRDRILYLLFFFAAVAIIASRVLAILTVGDRVKIIKDVGLASISIFGVLMAVLIGTSLVYKEIDKKTIFTLLSKPLHRAEFILGKFFGLVLTLLVMTVGMSLIFLGLVYLHTFRIEWTMLVAIAYIFLELVLITAVAILFSSFSTPILSSIFSLSFYLIGHLLLGPGAAHQEDDEPGAGRSAARFLYTFLPDLENFNFKTEVVHGLPIPAGIYLYSFLYGICYTAFILALAILIFRRRDFI